MMIDFDGQFILTWRQIGKAVTAAVSDRLSCEFWAGRARAFLIGRTEEDHARLRRGGALGGPFDRDLNFTE